MSSKSWTGNLGHKMWGAAPMTTQGVHRDICPYEKSIHLPKRYFLQNLGKPLLHAFFYDAL
jgi:hypothetical protein